MVDRRSTVRLGRVATWHHLSGPRGRRGITLTHGRNGTQTPDLKVMDLRVSPNPSKLEVLGRFSRLRLNLDKREHVIETYSKITVFCFVFNPLYLHAHVGFDDKVMADESDIGKDGYGFIDLEGSELGGFSGRFNTLGWHLKEIHVTWAHLGKKRKRLQLYINVYEKIAHNG
ncbi:hypothetical protein Tco_1036363 [Tanacetum coccineum]